MPGAGFYAIHTSKISFRRDGRWYADDEPVVHRKLALLFSRHVRRKPDAAGYEIWIDERYHADVEIEDTAFVVTTLDVAADGRFVAHLNDDSAEVLDLRSLVIGSDGALSCGVKGGLERARLLRSAQAQLADYVDQLGDGTFEIRCGAHRVSIAQLE